MSAQAEALEQACWACGTVVHVPVYSSGPVGLFKCGWCQALVTFDPARARPATPAGTAPPPSNQRQLQLAAPLPPAPPAAARVAGGALLAVVVALISGVAIVGMAVLLPGAYNPAALTALHYPFTALLVLGILFSYSACVLGHPGPPQRLVAAAVGSDGSVPQGAFDDLQYCERCRYYKPPTAHHCRSCGTCVCGLDHHCWYLGNQCVGEANLPQFLRFLVYLVLGVGYALLAAVVMGWRDRQAIVRHTQRTWQAGTRASATWHLLSFSLRWILSGPIWMGLWGFSFVICSLTFVLVGLLLLRQLQLLARGQNYLDVLQYQQQQYQRQLHTQQYIHGTAAAAAGSAAAAGLAGAGAGNAAGAGQSVGAVGRPPISGIAAGTPPSGAWRPPLGVPAAWWESAAGRSMRRVFGDGHPLTWLLPLGRAPGAACGGAAKKRH